MSQEDMITRSASYSKYDARYTAAILLNSFRFGQRSDLLQGDELRYMAYNYGPRFDRQVILDCVPAVSRRAFEIANDPARHKLIGVTHADATYETEQAVDALVGALDNLKKGIKRTDTLRRIAEKMVEWDVTHLGLKSSEQKARSRDEAERVTPANDRFLTQWVHYGLLARHTGMPEYNAMFRDVVAAFDTHGGYESSLREDSGLLVVHHVTHHENDKQSLSHRLTA